MDPSRAPSIPLPPESPSCAITGTFLPHLTPPYCPMPLQHGGGMSIEKVAGHPESNCFLSLQVCGRAGGPDACPRAPLLGGGGGHGPGLHGGCGPRGGAQARAVGRQPPVLVHAAHGHLWAVSGAVGGDTGEVFRTMSCFWGGHPSSTQVTGSGVTPGSSW